MPPVTVTPWRETRAASTFGPVCPQLLPDTRNETLALASMGRGRLRALRNLKPILSNQSEDCLYLNVYAPVTGKSDCYLTAFDCMITWAVFLAGIIASRSLQVITFGLHAFDHNSRWMITGLNKKSTKYMGMWSPFKSYNINNYCT